MSALAILLALAPLGQPPPPRQAAIVQPAEGERRILVMLRLPPEHYRATSDYGTAGGYGDAAAASARRRLARRIARAHGLTLVDNWPMPILGVDCVVMAVPGAAPLARIAAEVSHDGGVAWAQPLNLFEAQGVPAARAPDRLFAAQPAAQAWRLAELHRIATGAGVRVAVIDSMVDAIHPDLRGQIATTRDFVGNATVPEGHGTGIAGIIAARADNGLGIAGIAPGARLLALRACRQRSAAATTCDTLSVARALVFALENGADVINMSLTGPRDLLLARLIDAGLRRGVAMVAAADPKTGGGFPASLPGVVAVAQDGLAATGPDVYIAPGRDVPTTEAGGGWHLVSGSSYAAAHVSGLLALVRQLGAGAGRRALAATRGQGGAIDACGTLLRATERHGGRCGANP